MNTFIKERIDGNIDPAEEYNGFHYIKHIRFEKNAFGHDYGFKSIIRIEKNINGN
ncbi:MAG: hypothetical protein LBQ28_06505 [Prevotellaceae bacterium]|jgi:hypothetical protein|nr:hypothetical protein [Prevotellaceae bacterium]